MGGEHTERERETRPERGSAIKGNSVGGAFALPTADSQTTDQGPSYNGSGNSSGTPHSGSLSPLSELEEDQANSTAQPDTQDEARSPRSPPIEIVAASGTKATVAPQAGSAAGGCTLDAGSTKDSSHDGVVSTEVAQATQSAYRKFLGGFSLSPASSSSQTASTTTTTPARTPRTRPSTLCRRLSLLPRLRTIPDSRRGARAILVVVRARGPGGERRGPIPSSSLRSPRAPR